MFRTESGEEIFVIDGHVCLWNRNPDETGPVPIPTSVEVRRLPAK